MPFSLSVALFHPPPPPTDSPGLNPEIPASESGTHGHVLGYKQRISGLPIMGFVDSDPEEGGGGGERPLPPPAIPSAAIAHTHYFPLLSEPFLFSSLSLVYFSPFLAFFPPFWLFFPHFPPFLSSFSPFRALKTFFPRPLSSL